MKIKQLSDLHLEHIYPYCSFDVGEGDVLILAGDIMCARHLKKNGLLNQTYRKFLTDCSNNYTNVLYIMGNHEFYGYNYEGTIKTIREVLPPNIHLLQNHSIEINGIHFIGCTFWTNFYNENPIEMLVAQSYMNDYKTIRIGSNFRKLNPNDVLSFHKLSFEYIQQKVSELENERVFIITHHSPTLQAIHPKYKTESCNGSYCSNLDEFILANKELGIWSCS
jgi:predicted MPP superfamily phosphohydrolase